MYCTKCGKETRAEDSFCRHCGAPVRQGGSAPFVRSTMGVVTPAPAPVRQSPEPATRYTREEYRAWVHQTIRDYGKSVVFLLCAVFYTLAILLQAYEFSSTSWMSLLSELDIPYELRRELRNLSGDGMLLVNIISMVPQFLTVLSLWLIYGGSFAKRGHGPSGAGLMILKVLEIIRIVFLSLALLLIFIAMFASCSAAGDYGSDGAMLTVLTVFSVFIGILVLLLVISGKTVGIYNTIRRSMDTGSPSSDLSGFVAVVTMLCGTVNVVSVAFIFSGYTLLLGIAQVIMGLQIFFYKSAMKELENNSHLYMSSYIGAAKTDGSIPTWKRLAMENGFDDNY